MSGRDPVVVLAADRRYAMPLATTLRSAQDALDRSRGLQVFAIDGGLSEAQRARVEASLDRARVTLRWFHPRPGAVSHMKATGHVTTATYLRLLVPEAVPASCDKALYLDCDLIVRGDLGRLWDEDLGDHPLLAVQDASVPTVSCPRGLANHRALGLDPALPYFNAGVLLLDVARWREEAIGPRVVRYLEENRDAVRWWDQDGMNALLAGRWGALDPRWNQLPHLFDLASWRESPFPREVFEACLRDPRIVHFATSSKPWHFGCRHPSTALFFECLDRTAWAGWRPRRRLRDTGLGRGLLRARRGLGRAVRAVGGGGA